MLRCRADCRSESTDSTAGAEKGFQRQADALNGEAKHPHYGFAGACHGNDSA
jgi:hypothetical protein